MSLLTILELTVPNKPGPLIIIFHPLLFSIGQPSTFWLYSCLGVLGLIFMILLVPETKGRKLEDVEELFHRPWFMNWCTKRR